MLSPDVRTVAMDLLRPPSQHRLDLAVLTTYTLDLEALVALPLAVLSQSDSSVDELMADPLRLIAALQEAGDRIHVFVDETGIAIPDRGRELVSTLESSVHPVRAQNGGVFHPKVWLARFLPEEDASRALLRLAILSRNLTFDRSWDVALTSEAVLGRRPVAASRPLGELLAELPNMASRAGAPLRKEVSKRVSELAEQARRTAYPAPDGFDSPLEFHCFGIENTGSKRRRSRSRGAWPPKGDATRVLAVAPFTVAYGTEKVAAMGREGAECTLIARPDRLDLMAPSALDGWSEVLVLSEEPAAGEATEEARRPSGLHAKIVALEHRGQVTWYFGSANLTQAALTGRNVEVLARLTGRRGQVGIERFMESFRALCEPYDPDLADTAEEDDTLAERQCGIQKLEAAQAALVQAVGAGRLRVRCRGRDGDIWDWRMHGKVADDIPEGVTAHFWPTSIPEEQSHPLDQPSWSLPVSSLTAFVAFRMNVGIEGVDDLRFAMRLPAPELPPDRPARILRSLIDNPTKFLQFLRALLSGVEGESLPLPREGEGSSNAAWEGVFSGETLLEDLLHVASRSPERLDVVRRLVKDLRRTEEGRAIVPSDLYELWQAIDQTAARR